MDCNHALEIDPNYIKGLFRLKIFMLLMPCKIFRRAVALEAMGLITTAKQDIERLLKLSDDNAANAILDRLKKKVTIFYH